MANGAKGYPIFIKMIPQLKKMDNLKNKRSSRYKNVNVGKILGTLNIM